MLAPQQDDEVRPVVEALRRLDSRLDILWNPKAYVERAGTFDAIGQPMREPTYAARWQVVLRDKATSLHEERDYTLVCTVTVCDWRGRYPTMQDRGDYAPIGEWLVRYMEVWDAAQAHFRGAMDALWAEHERAEQYEHDAAATQEALEKVYREHGSEYWVGGAQGRAAPETLATLYRTDGPAHGSSPPDSSSATEKPLPPGRARVAAALAVSTP